MYLSINFIIYILNKRRLWTFAYKVFFIIRGETMYQLKKFFILFVSMIVLILMSQPTYALTVEDVSTKDMALKSDLVVMGKVIHRECKWEDANQKAINTFSTIKIDKYLKGEGDEFIIVKQLGGKIGDITDVIDGIPFLNKGEEVILFLSEFKGEYVIFSMALGYYKIEEDENNNKYAKNDLSNVNLIVPEKLQNEATGIKIKSFVLSEFLSEVVSSVN